MIRRSPASRLFPLVALMVLSAPPGKGILDRYRARLATAPAGGATSAGGTR